MPDSTSVDLNQNQKLPRQVALILGILLGANFVVSLNETVLGVALPVLMRNLHISASVGQWLTTAFLLTMAAVIPATGFLQAKYSTRTLFFAAMGVFTLGTLVGALSGSFAMLLIARVLQASGTALLMPMFTTTMMHIVPQNLRGMVMGQIGLVFSVAPALGPAVSGLIVQFWGWHALFWVVLPIAVLAIFIGGRWLHLDHEPGPIRLDVFSLLLSGVGFSALVYGLSEAGVAVRGNGTINPLIFIVAGAIIVAWFLRRQVRLAPTNSGLLNLGSFASRAFRNSLSLMSLMMVILFGTIIMIPIYTQGVLHQSALTTGLLMMPGGILQGVMGPVAGKLYDRVGARRILIPALSAMALSIGAMTLFGTDTSVWAVFGAFTLLSTSLAFVFPVVWGTSISGLGPEHFSHGSAIFGVSQQVSGAAGTAGFVAVLTILAGGSTTHASALQLNAGTHGAYLVGFVLSLGAIALAPLIKPDLSVTGATNPQ